MGSEKKAIGIITIDYVKRYKTMSSSAIARALYSDRPDIFKSFEHARDTVRYYRGSKSCDKNSLEYKENARVQIPEPDEEKYEPYVLDAFPIIAGGDAHVPYHSRDALEIFIERAVEIGAKTVLLAGDWLDCYHMSRFMKDPNRRNILEEIEIMKQVLSVIRNALPDAKIVYKEGNHEERFDAYLMNNAPELFRLDNVRLKSVLDLESMGIEYVSEKRIVRASHLNILHGHEYIFSISNPVNPARGLYNRAKKSALCFHHHQTSEHTEPTINGEIVTTWSAGCLCGLRPAYMPLNKWNHGFSEIVMEDEMFNVRNRKLINYKLV